MWTRKPGLQTSWPGSPTIPLTKSPIYSPGIGRRTWRSRPPLLLERSSWKIAPTWGAGRVRTLVLKTALEERNAAVGRMASWPQIIADLDSLTETEIEYDGKRFIVRSAPG